MQTANLVIVLLALSAVAYLLAHNRSVTMARPLGGIRHLHSLPFYYGMRAAIWCALPAVLLLVFWLMFDDPIISLALLNGLPESHQPATMADQNLLLNSVENIASGALSRDGADPVLVHAANQLSDMRNIGRYLATAVVLSLGVIGLGWGWVKVSPQLRARQQVEKVFKIMLLSCACVAILTTLGILLSVLFESMRFFKSIPVTDFLFGTEWSPQMAIRADQVGSSGSFGAIPLFVGTLLISMIAMVVAVPVGLMSAIYLAEYASPKFRGLAKPALEILAGIPTVVYGFFAALTVAPFLRQSGESMGLQVSSESALAAGLVMGVMIIPFVSSLADDVINAVPQSLRDGSLGLGATRSETIKQVIFPAALPGIVGGVLLAVSRAIGETMIVVMAAGLAAQLTLNPLETVTTVTVQIVTLLVGDQEFDSPKTLAAFALGLMLFLVTLVLNFIALRVVKKYREQYD
ncbi:MAG: phosphate ABC transporter permease subunit PstC [Gammaproteobacteria bacterium]|nr:MAG: phosphate ABC transporter permease subunit PstC [Gammaproteobacteria bacterium]